MPGRWGSPSTAVFDAAGARDCLVIHLIADSEALEERIRDREPAEWFGLPGLIASASQLADMRFSKTDLEIRTDQQHPDEVAASILAELRTRLGT